MRRTLAAALAAGLLLAGAAACGGDDEGGESSTGGGAEEAGSGGGGSGDFCADYMAASGSVDSDPTAAAEQLAGLEPPAEIAEAWDVMVSDESLSPSDMSPEVEAALTEVTDYVMTNCADELSTQLGELEGELGDVPTEVPGG